MEEDTVKMVDETVMMVVEEVMEEDVSKGVVS